MPASYNLGHALSCIQLTGTFMPNLDLSKSDGFSVHCDVRFPKRKKAAFRVDIIAIQPSVEFYATEILIYPNFLHLFW